MNIDEAINVYRKMKTLPSQCHLNWLKENFNPILKQMDKDLQETKWLASNEFGLADVSLTPYVNRVAMMGMSEWWEGRLPYLSNWWARIQEVPTFQSAILDWCPQDLTDDLMNFGSQSWPDVQKIIGFDD